MGNSDRFYCGFSASFKSWWLLQILISKLQKTIWKQKHLFFTSTDQSCPEFWDRSKDWLRREEGGFTQRSETAQHQVWSNTLSRVPLEREKEWVHQKPHSPLLAIHHSFVFSKILIPWSLLKSYLKLSDGSSCICFCYCLIWKKNEKDCRVFVYCKHITCRTSSIYNMCCCSVKAPESFWTLKLHLKISESHCFA